MPTYALSDIEDPTWRPFKGGLRTQTDLDQERLKEEVRKKGWQMTSDVEIGTLSYEEDASSVGVTSDLGSSYGKLNIEYGESNEEQLEAGIHISLFQSLEDEENWHLGGFGLIQTNDTDLWGVNASANLGWAFVIHDEIEESVILTPYAGYGYRFWEFSRSNFNVLGTVVEVGEVSEDYNIHYLDFGSRLIWNVSRKTSFKVGWGYGWVRFTEANNSELGKIEGEGGRIIQWDVALSYLFSENVAAFAGFGFESQNLDGGTSGNVIWPDNEAIFLGGKVGAVYRF